MPLFPSSSLSLCEPTPNTSSRTSSKPPSPDDYESLACICIREPITDGGFLVGRYINRFRSASKLQSEAGYYLSSLVRRDDLSFSQADTATGSRLIDLAPYPFRLDGIDILYRSDGSHLSLQYLARGVRNVRPCIRLQLFSPVWRPNPSMISFPSLPSSSLHSAMYPTLSPRFLPSLRQPATPLPPRYAVTPLLPPTHPRPPPLPSLPSTLAKNLHRLCLQAPSPRSTSASTSKKRRLFSNAQRKQRCGQSMHWEMHWGS
jgi:hypothetical protein